MKREKPFVMQVLTLAIAVSVWTVTAQAAPNDHEKVRIAVRNAEVKFTLIPRRRMGVDLEQWAVEKERDYFREIFGRELSTAAS